MFQLSAARVEISQLQGQCNEQQELIEQLKAELQNNVDEYATLSYQSKTVIYDVAVYAMVLLIIDWVFKSGLKTHFFDIAFS